MLRVIFCGSRDWSQDRPIIEALERLPKDTTVIHGAARGADRLSGLLASLLFKFSIEEYPANWELHGKSAGAIRNQEMLDGGTPDEVYAFYSGPLKSRGTMDMVEKARSSGLPVHEYMKGTGWLGE